MPDEVGLDVRFGKGKRWNSEAGDKPRRAFMESKRDLRRKSLRISAIHMWIADICWWPVLPRAVWNLSWSRMA